MRYVGIVVDKFLIYSYLASVIIVNTSLGTMHISYVTNFKYIHLHYYYFKKLFSKIKDKSFREQVEKQISKIIKDPNLGKPMKHNRKGTREQYVKPYRLSYSYSELEDKIRFLDLYHKDEQ